MLAKLKCAGGGHYAGVIRKERKLHGLRACRHNGLSKLNNLLGPSVVRDFDMKGVKELAYTLHHGYLTGLGHAGKATGELAHYFFFPATKLVEVDLRLTKRNAVGCHGLGLVHYRSHVQQRFGRNAAHIQADTTQRAKTFHQHRAHAKVCGSKGGGVAPWACAKHEHLGLEVGFARVGLNRRVGGGSGERY